MVLNKTTIPDQLIDWNDDYLLNSAYITEVIIAIEYLNSATILTSKLRKISQISLLSRVIFMN